MNRREGENREAEAIKKAWVLLADSNFLNGRQILVKLPYGWVAQPGGVSVCRVGQHSGWFQVAGEAKSGGFWSFTAIMGDEPVQHPD